MLSRFTYHGQSRRLPKPMSDEMNVPPNQPMQRTAFGRR
jgi:hypothetical protein